MVNPQSPPEMAEAESPVPSAEPRRACPAPADFRAAVAEFGSTIVLKSLHREPRRFPRAAIQGAFAHRPLAPAERLALRLGRLLPGNASRLPLRNRVLAWNNKAHFPDIISDRWDLYVQENG